MKTFKKECVHEKTRQNQAGDDTAQITDFAQTWQPRSQGLFPDLGAGREKTLASAGHVSTLHPEILGVIN